MGNFNSEVVEKFNIKKSMTKLTKIYEEIINSI